MVKCGLESSMFHDHLFLGVEEWKESFLGLILLFPQPMNSLFIHSVLVVRVSSFIVCLVCMIQSGPSPFEKVKKKRIIVVHPFPHYEVKKQVLMFLELDIGTPSILT